MKKLSLLLALSTLSGCAIYELPSGPVSDSDEIVIIEEAIPPVNATIYLPYELEELIRYRVEGYRMPQSGYYRDELFDYGNYASGRNSRNQPAYVIDDLNGDLYDDYSLMFSRESYKNGSWYLTTRLLVALADGRGGYYLSMDLNLGTVTGPASTPIEEYWAIGTMKAGVHSITTYFNNAAVTESVTLKNRSLFLTSLDPAERSIFYVLDYKTYEMSWDREGLAKRTGKDTRAERIIPMPPK